MQFGVWPETILIVAAIVFHALLVMPDNGTEIVFGLCLLLILLTIFLLIGDTYL